MLISGINSKILNIDGTSGSESLVYREFTFAYGDGDGLYTYLSWNEFRTKYDQYLMYVEPID